MTSSWISSLSWCSKWVSQSVIIGLLLTPSNHWNKKVTICSLKFVWLGEKLSLLLDYNNSRKEFLTFQRVILSVLDMGPAQYSLTESIVHSLSASMSLSSIASGDTRFKYFFVTSLSFSSLHCDWGKLIDWVHLTPINCVLPSQEVSYCLLLTGQ